MPQDILNALQASPVTLAEHFASLFRELGRETPRYVRPFICAPRERVGEEPTQAASSGRARSAAVCRWVAQRPYCMFVLMAGCNPTASDTATSSSPPQPSLSATPAATTPVAPSAGNSAAAPSLDVATPAASGSRAPTTTAGMRSSAGSAGAAQAGGASLPAAGSGGSTMSATPTPAGPNEWRMMGYDEHNWYFNPQEKALSMQSAKQLSEKWRFTVSGMPTGALSIGDGKVFAMSSGGVYAIDLQTGKQLWSRTDIVGSSAPAYNADALYIQTSLPPTLYKLRASDGKTVWGPVRNCNDDSSCSGESSPVLVGDTVYVGMQNNMAEASFGSGDAVGKRGGVRALRADTGELRWLYQTIPEPNAGKEDGASVWSTVSVDVAAGLLLATTGNNFTVAGPNGDAFHAIDLATGARRWAKQVREGDVFTAAAALAGKDTSKFDFDFGANPILAEIAGRRVVAAGDKGGTFWVLDRETGEIIWRRDDLSASADATFGGILMNGAYDGQAFYVVSNDAKGGGASLHRLDAAKGASTWKHTFQETTWGAPSLANGLVFVPNNTQLYVLDAETGEQLNKFETGGTMVGGAPAVAQGNVVVKSGFLYVDPNTRLNDQVICYALPSTTMMTQAAAGAGAAPPPTAASFSAVHQNIVVGTGCGTGQCHSTAAAGGLDLTTRDKAYQNLVGVAAMGQTAPGSAAPGCSSSGLQRVTPGDPARSLLVAKLEHTQTCGTPMPNAGTRLPDAQLQQVRAWISAGAKND